MNAEIELLKAITNITARHLNSIPDSNLSAMHQEAKVLINEFVELINKDIEDFTIEEIEDMDSRVNKLKERLFLDSYLNQKVTQN